MPTVAAEASSCRAGQHFAKSAAATVDFVFLSSNWAELAIRAASTSSSFNCHVVELQYLWAVPHQATTSKDSKNYSATGFTATGVDTTTYWQTVDSWLITEPLCQGRSRLDWRRAY